MATWYHVRFRRWTGEDYVVGLVNGRSWFICDTWNGAVERAENWCSLSPEHEAVLTDLSQRDTSVDHTTNFEALYIPECAECGDALYSDDPDAFVHPECAEKE